MIHRVETWSTGSGYRNGVSELNAFRGILRKSKSPRIRFISPHPHPRLGTVSAQSLFSFGDPAAQCASKLNARELPVSWVVRFPSCRSSASARTSPKLCFGLCRDNGAHRTPGIAPRHSCPRRQTLTLRPSEAELRGGACRSRASPRGEVRFALRRSLIIMQVNQGSLAFCFRRGLPQ